MASLGKIKFHGYHTAMEEVTLFNDGRHLQVRDHLLIEEYMTLFMMLVVLSINVMVLMETYTYTLKILVTPWREGGAPYISGGSLQVLKCIGYCCGTGGMVIFTVLRL